MKKIKSGLLALTVSAICLSCMKDAEPENGLINERALKSANSSKSTLHLNFTGLEDLGPKYRYEGWIIVNGAPISTGKFRVTPSGQMAPMNFVVSKTDLANATAFVLTIEPQADPDPAPSATKILAGEFTGSSATLTVSHMAALGNDFSSAMGKYLLATPTTSSMADEKSGVWFIDNTSGSAMPGLQIPVLPAGWKYEGWTVVDHKPLTTGTFLYPDMADMAAPFSGPMPGPPFPGEDYITNAPFGFSFPTDLSGSTIVLTIEPYPDNSPEPFFLKPLVGQVPGNATVHSSFMMVNHAATFPAGMVTRE